MSDSKAVPTLVQITNVRGCYGENSKLDHCDTYQLSEGEVFLALPDDDYWVKAVKGNYFRKSNLREVTGWPKVPEDWF